MIDRVRIPASLRSRERFVQFALVGGLGFLVDQSILIAIVEFSNLTLEVAGSDVTLEVAKIIAAETAIVVMFLVNDRWTFQAWGDTDRGARLRRLLRSNLVRIVGIVVATVVLSALVRGLGMNVFVANAIGIGCGFVVNYTFETLYTWRLGA